MSRLLRVCLDLGGGLPVVAAAGAPPGAAPTLPSPVPLRAWTTDRPGKALAFAGDGRRLYIGGKLTLAGYNGFVV